MDLGDTRVAETPILHEHNGQQSHSVHISNALALPPRQPPMLLEKNNIYMCVYWCAFYVVNCIFVTCTYPTNGHVHDPVRQKQGVLPHSKVRIQKVSRMPNLASSLVLA